MSVLRPPDRPEYMENIARLPVDAPFEMIKPLLLAIPIEERNVNTLKTLISDYQTLRDQTVLTIIAALYHETKLHGPNPAVTGRRFLDMKSTGQAHSVTAFFAAIEEWQPQQKSPEKDQPEKHPEQDRLWTRIMRALKGH